jgi:hypothetical protein
MFDNKKAAGPAKISMLQNSSCELPEDIECLETTGQTQTVTCPCASSNPGWKMVFVHKETGAPGPDSPQVYCMIEP